VNIGFKRLNNFDNHPQVQKSSSSTHDKTQVEPAAGVFYTHGVLEKF